MAASGSRPKVPTLLRKDLNMKSLCRLFGAVLLICLAGVALFLAGCGSSSKKTSNQPLEIVGAWNLTITPTGGGGSGSLQATFASLSPCPSGWGSSCFLACASADVCGVPGTAYGSLSTTTPDAGTPNWLGIGVNSDPVAAGQTTAIVVGRFDMFGTTDLEEFYDLTGTFNAATKGVSGSYTCDSGSPNPCSTTGTFSGTHQ